jgi:molybdate transport system substrate-binding protein
MQRRTLIKAAAAVPLAAGPSGGRPAAHCGDGVVWKPIVPVPGGIPALDGFTDTVPDIVGRLGVPIDLAIFTEGNHFPVLLGGEIIVPFRSWARRQPRYAALALDNIVVVTLPQSMIVAILLGGGLALGNMTLAVSRASGFYPDIVMSGAAPLARLRQAAVVAGEARVFARNRGLSLLVAAGNPLAIRGLADVARTGARVVLASETERGARNTYLAAVEALLGRQSAQAILARETTSFPGRLGIQHRDVLQAIATGKADVGIIVHHLARYFAETYPHDCTMVAVPGADRFSSTIAMVAAADPLRPEAARAFSEFVFDVAREVYPRYGFALMPKTEFGEPIRLE